METCGFDIHRCLYVCLGGYRCKLIDCANREKGEDKFMKFVEGRKEINEVRDASGRSALVNFNGTLPLVLITVL
jgi:hypothetical protein